MAKLITAERYPLWNNFGGSISSWISQGVLTNTYLEQYFDYHQINYGDISFPKWVWRFIRYNTDPRKLFDLQVSWTYTESDPNSPLYQNQYTNSLDWHSKPNRFDINTSGTDFGGTLQYDDLWRMQYFPLQQTLNRTMSPNEYQNWYWPLDGEKSIQVMGGGNDGTVFESDAYDTTQNINHPKGTNHGYFTGDIRQFDVFPVHNCQKIVYSVNSSNELDAIQGMVVAPMILMIFDFEYGGPITLTNGGQIANRTVYKTFKSVEIGGYVLNSSYVSQTQYNMGFRVDNSTISIQNFDIGGLNLYIKTIDRDYDDDDVAGGTNTNYTYGGSLETASTGGGIDSNLTRCKLTPTVDDFAEAFVSGW